MKQLEQFNAETTPLGTELITRDGREVTEWYYFKKVINESFPIRAVIGGRLNSFTKEGKYYNTYGDDDRDLFIKPKVKEVWYNVYCIDNVIVELGVRHNTQEEAINNKERGYIKTIRITDELE